MDAAASRLLGAEDRYRLAGRKVLGGGGGARDTLPAWGFLPLPRSGERSGCWIPVVPGASERRFRGLRLKLLVSFGVGGRWLKESGPSGPARSGSGRRWNVSRAPGWEWNLVCFLGGGAERLPSWACGWGLLSVFVVVDARAACLSVGIPLVCP